MRLRDIASAFILLPLSIAGAAAPGLLIVPISLIKRMVAQPDTPASFKGNDIGTVGVIVSLIALLVIAGLQLIPWYYFQQYKKMRDDPGENSFELSPKTLLVMGLVLYLGSAAAIIAVSV